MRAAVRFLCCFLFWALLSTCSAGVDSFPAFGFEAEYDVPVLDPELDYGDGGSQECYWHSGPHAGFEGLDLESIALESLAWFEGAPEAAQWRDNPSARLVLVYPSGTRTVMARHTPDGELSWEQELRAWFEHFPPGEDGAPDVGEVAYPWTVEFGLRGGVRGVADTDLAALETMKSLAAGLGTAPLFAGPSFQLLATVRRSSHEMDVFGADTESLAELDDLPRIVREKRAERGE